MMVLRHVIWLTATYHQRLRCRAFVMLKYTRSHIATQRGCLVYTVARS
jgi:hypothetical protein